MMLHHLHAIHMTNKKYIGKTPRVHLQLGCKAGKGGWLPSPLLQMNVGTPFSITISITMIQLTWHGPKIRGKTRRENVEHLSTILFTCKLTVTLHSKLDDCIDPRRSTLGLAPKKPRTPPTLATSAWVAPLMVVFLGAAS